MIRSMTAFGRAKRIVGGKDVTVEIRSVNNRFFDCSVRLPRSFTFLEEKIKPYLQAKSVFRGKVEVFIGIDVINSQLPEITVDKGYAAAYISALQELAQAFPLKDDISVMSVAQNRDIFIIRKSDEDLEKEWEDVRIVLDEALERFIDGRKREGDNIEADIKAKIATVSAHVERIEAISLSDISSYKEKLEARLREMLSDNKLVFEESRILTECAIFADKIAIDEEIVRLRSHFSAFSDILSSNDPAGRKLDFLLQEMNREINTIGSKCQNSSIARIVVDVKAELEKIREQIQNIE